MGIEIIKAVPLNPLSGCDPVHPDEAALHDWQDRLAPQADDLPHIAFADLALQNRWLLKIAPDDYAASILRTLA